MKTDKIIFRESSGNVFADLGLEDADDLMAKAELALAIRKRIEQMGLNQTQAAGLMGTTQARVSELYNAKVMKMTFDRLLGFLNALGCDTHIGVESHDTDGVEKQGRVMIENPVRAMAYATNDGSTMALEIKEGQARWTERVSPDAKPETVEFDQARLMEIAEMFKDRSQGFLVNTGMAVFGDDSYRLNAGDCAYIAALLQNAAEQTL